MREAEEKKGPSKLKSYFNLLKKNPILFRAAEGCLEQSNDPAEQMYFSVWAPALVEFVCWVLNTACREQKKRLYFLSRDAYPMYLAAVKLNGYFGLDLDIRYLRVSRYALRIPEYHRMGIDCLDRIFLSGIDISMQQILRRGGLDKEQIQKTCEEIGYNRGLEELLNRNEIQKWKARARQCCLEGRTQLLGRIQEKSRKAYDAALGYLVQEGMLEDVPYAIVDSGWVGSIEKSLRTLLAGRKPEITMDGYYFGLYELPPQREGCRYRAYYFMPKGKVARKMNFSNCLYEVLYSEPCRMTNRYQFTGERYEPVSSGVPNPNEDKLKKNNASLEQYMDFLLQLSISRNQKMELLHGKYPQVTEGLFRTLMARPDEWEARYYGNWLFSDDIADDHLRNAANVLSMEEIRNLRVMPKLFVSLGLSHKVIHESAWIEGSIVNLGKDVSVSLRAAHRAKYLTHLRQSLRAGRE